MEKLLPYSWKPRKRESLAQQIFPRLWYVCVCIVIIILCMYIYIYKHIHTHTNTRTHLNTHTQINIHTNTHNINTHVHANTSYKTHTHTYKPTHACVYVCVCVCMCVCVHAYMCVPVTVFESTCAYAACSNTDICHNIVHRKVLIGEKIGEFGESWAIRQRFPCQYQGCAQVCQSGGYINEF